MCVTSVNVGMIVGPIVTMTSLGPKAILPGNCKLPLHPAR